MKKLILLLLILTFSGCKKSPDIIWRFQTGGPIQAGPAIAGDLLVIGSSDTYFYGLDLETGKQAWKRNLGTQIWATPAAEKNSIYIGGNGDFFSLRNNDGAIQWKYAINGRSQYKPCLDESGIYFGSNGGSFYKIDRSGQKIWEFQGKKGFWGDCAFYKNLVLTSSWDTNFYAFDRSTGEVVWSVSSGIINYGGPAISGDTVYFATHDKLFHLDAATGTVRHISKTGYLNYPVVANGFLWTNDGGVAKRSLDGKLLATFPDSMNNQYFRPLKTKNFLIVSANPNILYGLSDELQVLWKFKKGDGFYSAGVIHNGRYYTGNRDHYVYALKLPD